MEYVFLCDDCQYCNYLSNTFSLLEIGHRKVLLSNSDEQICSSLHSTLNVFFVCQHATTRGALLDKLSTLKGHLIFFGDRNDLKKLTVQYFYFLKTPFSLNEFRSILAKCNHPHLDHALFQHPAFQKLVGESPVMTNIKSMILKAAETETTVLILGNSGTGKDIIASCIHQLSKRKSYPFVPINCGAIPNDLMESELFGHEKGAFTGALTKRTGRFEFAQNGTLFLDEIGDMPLSMQVKLLRVLQDKKIERVGGNQSLDIDVRLIAATHKKLELMIKEGTFRTDLFYRLNVFPIQVPTLHERKEDIELIINYQLSKISERLHHSVSFTPDAMNLILEYPWPGNIRELQNFLERMVILYPDQIIAPDKIKLFLQVMPCEKKKSKMLATQ